MKKSVQLSSSKYQIRYTELLTLNITLFFASAKGSILCHVRQNVLFALLNLFKWTGFSEAEVVALINNDMIPHLELDDFSSLIEPVGGVFVFFAKERLLPFS